MLQVPFKLKTRHFWTTDDGQMPDLRASSTEGIEYFSVVQKAKVCLVHITNIHD